MLVLTRRPGESIKIGEDIEFMIVDADFYELETRCAIRVCNKKGKELRLQSVRTEPGVTLIRTLG